MRQLWALLLVTGCRVAGGSFFGPGGDDVGPGDGGADTNQGDGSGTPADAQQCFGAGAYLACFTTLPTMPTTITDSAIIDTATSSSCLPAQLPGWTTAGQPDACFIVGTNINVSNVRVFGTRPLVLVATNQISITGVVDAASHNIVNGTGPGAPYASCAAFQSQASYSSGGAGGSFMSRGGRGGDGGGGAGQPGGVSALAEATPPLKLRAGCSGQTGGDGTLNPSPGGAGTAGGAVYFVAGSTISLGSTSIINVSGSGGGGGLGGGGGGGAGSGGMIVLYAPTITATGAKLVANGGAGGTGGAGNSLQQPNGRDPDPNTPGSPATGVSGSSGTGIGGNGYATTALNAVAGAASGASSAGGGGGGAGAGYIQSNVMLTGADTSPNVTVQ